MVIETQTDLLSAIEKKRKYIVIKNKIDIMPILGSSIKMIQITNPRSIDIEIIKRSSLTGVEIINYNKDIDLSTTNINYLFLKNFKSNLKLPKVKKITLSLSQCSINQKLDLKDLILFDENKINYNKIKTEKISSYMPEIFLYDIKKLNTKVLIINSIVIGFFSDIDELKRYKEYKIIPQNDITEHLYL